MDFNDKMLYLKQKQSCKFYQLKLKSPAPDENGQHAVIDKLPNIAEIFDLWPYFMYYNSTTVIDNKT